MWKRKRRENPAILAYSQRFRHHIQPADEIFDVGAAYNVSWAMEYGDSADNGLLIVCADRLFHCLDYGVITWEVAQTRIMSLSSSDHPMPQTKNLHVTYLDGGVHSQMTFYSHPLFVKSVVELLRK